MKEYQYGYSFAAISTLVFTSSTAMPAEVHEFIKCESGLGIDIFEQPVEGEELKLYFNVFKEQEDGKKDYRHTQPI